MMNDEKYPLIFKHGIENAETMQEISDRSGIGLREIRSSIIFWLVKGKESGCILLSTPDHKFYIENKR